jgi:hypothetical protein
MPVQKWEYLIKNNTQLYATARSARMDLLNVLGRKGWELVAILNYGKRDDFFFKRPLDADEDELDADEDERDADDAELDADEEELDKEGDEPDDGLGSSFDNDDLPSAPDDDLGKP